MTSTDHDLLARLERYYDAVPRTAARTEAFGPLTLFVREGAGWPYYARPALPGRAPVTEADVRRVLARQRELGIPEAFEWVAETSPTLRAAAERAGLVVHEHPLMVLAPEAPTPGVPEPDGTRVRIVGPEDPALPSALAVPHLAFAEPGTRVGSAGPTELAAAIRERAGDVDRMAARIRTGLSTVAAAVRDGWALCAGQYLPVGEVAEIAGLGTLPTARRQGLALAVTAALVADARAAGVRTVFLSAGDADVARIYARLGFRTVGTALIAEPATA
ncbi:GNAT family N-acetyltransferase [Kitasatospora kifunensis]|uniref:N-acetylglutamate synthase-like GNAT family acetyltransferase n=1 Tax=Kitasatospora kifunensis TaxID=58351 RepID=A0A7W7R083_KITKI|nr:GNAT family N-acetyltransferase [Kitasatospora kifunensis]MBB4923050.1 N-acetylglutamate synthase-like GNAT family acetyltransferase [Kitasatospora kifunensis]